MQYKEKTDFFFLPEIWKLFMKLGSLITDKILCMQIKVMISFLQCNDESHFRDSQAQP